MMTQILVQPPQLRQTAEQLRAHAQKIDQALRAIDNDIRSLKSHHFLGNRADAVQSHYAPKREALLASKELVLRFAEELNLVANTFEKADATVENKLFIHDPFDKNEIDINDVEQGSLGDCYLIAAIAAIAQQNPELIRDMIHDNGDGTYTVTFHAKNKLLGFETDGYSDVEITVSLDGNEYAHLGDQIGNSQEVWVQVIEKAYAEWRGGYDHIEGGWPHKALEVLTGVDSVDYKPSKMTINDLASALDNGNAVTANSLIDYKIEYPWGEINIPDKSDKMPLYLDDTLAASHAYTIQSVDLDNGTVTLRNPWGFAHVTLNFDEFQQNFSGVSINSIQ